MAIPVNDGGRILGSLNVGGVVTREELQAPVRGVSVYGHTSGNGNTELRKWCVEQALIITGRDLGLSTIAVADEILAWVSK